MKPETGTRKSYRNATKAEQSNSKEKPTSLLPKDDASSTKKQTLKRKRSRRAFPDKDEGTKTREDGNILKSSKNAAKKSPERLLTGSGRSQKTTRIAKEDETVVICSVEKEQSTGKTAKTTRERKDQVSVKKVKKQKVEDDVHVDVKDNKGKTVKKKSSGADKKTKGEVELSEGTGKLVGSKKKTERIPKTITEGEESKTEPDILKERKRRQPVGEAETEPKKKQKLNKEPATRTKKAAKKSPKTRAKRGGPKKGEAEEGVAEVGVVVEEEVDGDTEDKVIPKMAKEVAYKAAKFVGAHMSIAGGIENAVKDAVQTGARAFALFLRSQRQWAAKPLDDKTAEKFREACNEHNFPPHLILPHGSYLLNCGSPNEETLHKSREALADELNRCEKLGLTRYNFHPGSSCGQITLEECLDKIGESINMVHQQTNNVMTVIENMSCQGSTVGGKFEELRGIIERVKDKSRIGVCLDTCHAFAAGFDLSSEAGYQAMMADFDRIIGLEYMVAVHLNDSKGKVGSHLDRHENIGQGKIGLKAFQLLMNDPRFDNIPLILETPVGDGIDYAKEIKLLNSLVEKS